MPLWLDYDNTSPMFQHVLDLVSYQCGWNLFVRKVQKDDNDPSTVPFTMMHSKSTPDSPMTWDAWTERWLLSVYLLTFTFPGECSTREPDLTAILVACYFASLYLY